MEEFNRCKYWFLNWKNFEKNEKNLNAIKEQKIDFVFLSDCFYEDSCEIKISKIIF